MSAVVYMVFMVVFGLLVVVPIVAILADRGKMGGGGGKALEERVRRLETDVAAGKHEIDELRELLHVNIIKMEDARELHQRLDGSQE